MRFLSFDSSLFRWFSLSDTPTGELAQKQKKKKPPVFRSFAANNPTVTMADTATLSVEDGKKNFVQKPEKPDQAQFDANLKIAQDEHAAVRDQIVR